MHILKVDEKYSESEFYEFPARLYQNDDHWVPTKLEEVERIFNTDSSTFFERDDVCRWILQNYRGATIGRIAAFVNKKETSETGFLGFFECIDHETAAFKLLEEGALWLKERGMTTVNAPVNPTSLFLKSGLLTEGFDELPAYGSNYHPAYYQQFFETFGFQQYLRQRIYHLDFQTLPFPRAIKEKAKLVMENKDFRIDRFNKEKLEPLAKDIAVVYNRTWSKTPFYHELSAQQIQTELQELLPWIDEDIFLLAYYRDQPIGFFFNLPDINQARKRAGNGLFSKVREAYYRKRKHKHLLSVSLGVLPEFQQRGVASALIKSLLDFLSKHEVRYDKIETNRVGEGQVAVEYLLQQFKGKPRQYYWIYQKSLLAMKRGESISQNSTLLKR
ncbi:GNAT family N-acetyltransferase [Tunicatimonas pelagia]|uniref:GNAT family N-acetyltransferase n=1 Tax=Tunicatimonas pelagia TaxID=931531 RepID=UPI002665DFEC|nr:GNAT family N-acetyltransferase [Tunicatimonas pelagia]WKN40594.1 GNAT family N-acetyltransferase [Tunicatimonas pelagia]